MHLFGGVETFGIFFQPTAFRMLFGVPISEFTNFAGDAVPLFGQEIRSMWNRLGESSLFEERVLIAEDFLMEGAARSVSQTGIVAAADYIFRRHGSMRVAELVDGLSLGIRQFERRFVQEIGVSPKAFARVARFQAALDAKVAYPQRSWLDIAHSFGYHDQMHMIHDFEALGCNTPTGLVAELGDSRPPALMPTKSSR